MVLVVFLASVFDSCSTVATAEKELPDGGGEDQSCKATAANGGTDGTASEIKTEDYGVPQSFEYGGEYEQQTIERIVRMDRYMREQRREEGSGVAKEVDDQKNEKKKGLKKCENQHELCSMWASLGECETNPSYMEANCSPACLSCHNLLMTKEERCSSMGFVPANSAMATASSKALNTAGDLDRIFERITTDPYYERQYKNKPRILSHPGLRKYRPHPVQQPWIVTIDDFLTDEECRTLIELGQKQGYQRSVNIVGNNNANNNNAAQATKDYQHSKDDGRTSSNAWCVDDCYRHPITTGIIEKIENLTGIPDTHNEYLQLLKYEEGYVF